MRHGGWHECWHRRRADAGALLVIALFFTFFFSWILFSDKWLLGGDALIEFTFDASRGSHKERERNRCK